MTKKIFRSIFLVAVIVFLACTSIIMAVMYGYFSTVQQAKLKDQTDLIVRGEALDGAAYFEGMNPDGYRVTWIDHDGSVLYDSEASADTMENHKDREEVREAFDNGIGESSRYSSTLSTKTLYRAVLLNDGTVVRVSVTQYTVLSLLLGMVQPIFAVFIVCIIISFLLAHNVAKRIVEPLNVVDLDHPLENDVYDELSPLLVKIDRQQRRIADQKAVLQRQQEEFALVTDHMNEGLILLNEKAEVLSINRAAMGLFNVGKESIGCDFLTVDRSIALQNTVKAALQGKHGEVLLTRNGRKYQMNASAILRDGAISGAVLLFFDVTDAADAEQQRREFTANVSHELKSPLQSIMGSAELLENGLVKAEDVPRFVGHIRSEAARLVVLIDDIIRLSQLDEGDELTAESVDLLALAQDTAASLADKAEKNGITLKVRGEPLTYRGVRRLLSEILFNLCDNAIKYNRPNGSVTVTVAKEEKGIALSVADTGIGIPPEHLNRIFERFYRVDKSHSKETGGTGLGLSIVKHAAQYHGATVEVQSKEGEGTKFTIHFTGALNG